MPQRPPIHVHPAYQRGPPRRLSHSKRGYDRTWDKLRAVVLADEPLCRFCYEQGRLTASAEIDHIQPIAERPDLRLDRDNLRALCSPCHGRRTFDFMHGNRY